MPTLTAFDGYVERVAGEVVPAWSALGTTLLGVLCARVSVSAAACI